MIIIAIDPGKQGGIAFHDTSSGKEWAVKMPETDHDIADLIRPETFPGEDNIVVVLEQVGGFIGKAQPGSAMFAFGKNYGFLTGLAVGFRYKLFLVRPQTWQAGLGIGTASAAGSKSAWKNKLKQKAQHLFPREKVTLATADALLILDWAKHNPGIGLGLYEH